MADDLPDRQPQNAYETLAEQYHAEVRALRPSDSANLDVITAYAWGWHAGVKYAVATLLRLRGDEDGFLADASQETRLLIHARRQIEDDLLTLVEEGMLCKFSRVAESSPPRGVRVAALARGREAGVEGAAMSRRWTEAAPRTGSCQSGNCIHAARKPSPRLRFASKTSLARH
jgi:hypothetical protein